MKYLKLFQYPLFVKLKELLLPIDTKGLSKTSATQISSNKNTPSATSHANCILGLPL